MRRALEFGLALLLLAAGAGAAAAQDLPILQPGEPAPAAGLLFDEERSKRLVEDLRDLQTLRSVDETRKAELAAKDQQIAALEAQVKALQDAARAAELTYARMEERDKMRQEMQGELVQVLGESRKVLQDTRDSLKRADDRIETLEKRQFWYMLLGPIGFGIGYLMFGF